MEPSWRYFNLAAIRSPEGSPMNKHRSPMITNTLLTVITIAMLSAFSLANVNAQPGAAVARSIEGVWLVTISPRNCITGIPIPGAAFESLFTYHKGGTMSVWAQNSMIFVTRSPSHGLWQRDQGWSNYSHRFVHLRYDGSGSFIGRQDASGFLELSESGDEFTAEGSTTFFDADGNPEGVGCASMVGTRY
jgi:hypothetical protein